MKRVRFTIPVTDENKGDTRSVIWPTQYPYWESGNTIGDDFEITGSTMVAFTPDEDPLGYLSQYWPEITDLSQIEIIAEDVPVSYTDRFPQPVTHDANGILLPNKG